MQGGPARRPTDFLLVTGLSGAGLQTAAKSLEDLGWYVADNLPPELISRMVDLTLESDSRVDRLAVVIDVRSRLFTGDLGWVLKELETKPIHTRVLYLDASDDVLIRRFEQVRRSHPLQYDGIDGTLSEGIAAERDQLAPVKAAADLVIDTSALQAHQLRHRIEDAFGTAENLSVQVTVQSFGFKYGLPTDADMVCDVRFLPNPHWIPELRPQTGQSAPVRDYVLSQDGAQDYLSTYHHVLDLTITGYRREGKRYMTIAVGCTGGKHRSVAMSEALAARLGDDHGLAVRVVHRDLGRE
ncbi:RNase adapter RapZ [Rhodococcus triatomae]|uniref:RNase adapter RapZ n=1 Tax=Rhodococcus triatomae TaxID=300028 RepID=UPI0011138940|nr:RNase adapter RapZ [Rhodococcus triatomae]QNG21332.1 RNase adapter RapZ [Rhodococcus triatomae]QNG25927.1 RNase adapter RapZ [Rhodococcus triatomae]